MAALLPGTRIGQYEILGPLGAGGMGEVYRARDLRLEREVAIKVLPAAFTADAALRQRLTREAKILAKLNHHNIAAIYGVEDSGQLLALVMELVEGPTLASRMASGPVPVPEALAIARQVAEALEVAHERNIVHRDLKPTNIKIRPEGQVKVLDFGVAKVLSNDTVGDDSGDASTVTRLALTADGQLIGTGPYMSPEQAQGLPVERRTDIWAFGVVLWEMLTGTPLFRGQTLTETLAAVLRTEPDWDTLPPATPLPIRRLLRRSLQKSPRDRLDSATVARLDIEEALSTSAVDSSPSSKSVVFLALASLLAVALVWALTRFQVTVNPAHRAPIRLTAELGAELALRKDLGPSVVLSPDGRTVVFATRATTEPSLLYVRRLDQPSATPLRATEDATSPFFSPDGKWLAFFAAGKLQRISVADGTAAPICDAPSGRGGTWARDGSIVFTPGTALKTVLMRVPAAGGQPVPLSTLLDGELTHRWPDMLPGDVGVLYTSNTSSDWNDARVMVQPLPNGTPKMVHPGFFGRYVSSGHLLFARGGTLYAAPFDIDRLEVTGPSTAIVDNVVTDASTGGAQFAVSDTGTLVFLDGPPNNSDAQMLAWMDRAGSIASSHTTPLDWVNPQVSPDGRRLALDIRDGKQIDVWVQELSTRNLSRLTFDPSDDKKPIWSPDGEHIVFTSNRGGAPNLYQQRADGSGTAERLTDSQHPQGGTSWHPGGRLLALYEERPNTGRDLLILHLQRPAGARAALSFPTVFTKDRGNEVEGVFSPDGRWLAYTSNETGRAQVFVRGFPQGGKWQISNGGGRDASWSRARSELLFFDTTQRRIMVAPYAVAGDSFRAQEPRDWSGTSVGRPARDGRTFAVHPDGERVLIVPPSRRGPEHMTLILNFSEQLGGLGSPRQ